MTQTYDVLCVNTTSLKTFSFTVSKTVQKMLQTDHYVDFCFVFVFAFLFCLICNLTELTESTMHLVERLF